MTVGIARALAGKPGKETRRIQAMAVKDLRPVTAMEAIQEPAIPGHKIPRGKKTGMADYRIGERLIAGPQRQPGVLSEHHDVVTAKQKLAGERVHHHFLATHLGVRRFRVKANTHGVPFP